MGKRLLTILGATVMAAAVLVTLRIPAASAADPYAGYVLTYFGGEPYVQTLHIATSQDGLHWTTLNSNQGVLFATSGTRAVRDPYVIRKQDGTFTVMATQGWDTDSIYLWDSKDLVTFTGERLVKVNNFSGRTWAPQAIWDPVANNYVVYWSSYAAGGGRNKTWYNTTTDFRTFSAPRLLFDPGFDEIDADIRFTSGAFYLFFKSEVNRSIYLAKSASLTPGSFAMISPNPISPPNVEGPTSFRSLTANRDYVYYDKLDAGGVFGLSTSTAIGAASSWTAVPASGFSLPTGVRHGTVFPATQAEINRIKAAYTPFSLVSASNGTSCLGVEPASRDNGTGASASACTGAQSQKWIASPQSELKVYGNKCLEPKERGTAPGTLVHAWDCNGLPSQKWAFQPDGTIRGQGSGLCLDIRGGGIPADGTPMILWGCAGQRNQRFTKTVS
ncbi:MAG: alpha-L-arabinofuranosidase [Actinomycetia bacterium]|nr:alpha-L-arabinofuranosidase [Actinomycetes bacterium]